VRAVVQDTYGETDVLELRDIEKPTAGAGEVVVRVVAAGMDQSVWHLMAGVPYLVRPVFGLRRPKLPVRGWDLAGIVESVADGVTRFSAGNEVFGVGNGSFAEFACSKADKLAAKPAALTFEHAAILPTSGSTALQAVRDHGKVEPGQTVLVIGAGGGVGSYAVQIAKAFGASVTGVCSEPKVELVRSLGADHVIDYARENFADSEQRYDVIVDTGGNASLPRLRSVLTPKGTLVIVGAERAGTNFAGGMSRTIRATLTSAFVGQKLGTFLAKERHEDFAELARLVVDGKVKPPLDRTFPLAEVPQAIDYMRESRALGKVAIAVAPVS
jgi:NADPH:quinone reductase-like Zn-dependent oxidoreductase